MRIFGLSHKFISTFEFRKKLPSFISIHVMSALSTYNTIIYDKYREREKKCELWGEQSYRASYNRDT